MFSMLRHQALVDVLVEERHVVGALFEHRLRRELEKPFRQVGIVVQIGECDLGLDHPELGEMAGGVGVLGAERRAEGVDLGEREAVGLDVELARYGQERLAAEEVLPKSILPAGVRGRLARSSVETRNSAPAPSASVEVMIGVCTQKKPFVSK